MGVTISTHNGSAVAREHNIRNRKVTDKEGHIDPHGKHEIWIDEKPKEAYERLFGQAVEKYNDKQKRADRKIKDYYQQICGDKKKHPVYEMIISVGDRTNYADRTLREQDTRAILREFVDGWQARNPHLTLIGAYYHADEQGAPHAHLDYIPVAHGYKRGLETQSALVKALEQQGFVKDGKETAQIQWERRENAHLESLCLSRGIEVIHPRIEGREHLETDLYQLKADTDRAVEDLKKARDEVSVIRDSVLSEVKPPKKLFSKKQEITEDTLEYIKRVDKRVSEVLKRTQATQQALEEAQRAEERAKKKEKEATARLDRLDKEVELRAERKISAAKSELERATKEFQQATTAVKQRFNKAVADGIAEGIQKVTNRKKEALNTLAEYCNKLQMQVGNEKITVWQAYTRSWNSTLETRSIDLIKEIYEISSKFDKQQKAAAEKAPELPKRRNGWDR